jgi:hypothetical protein
MARLFRQNGDAAHEGATNTKNMNVHVNPRTQQELVWRKKADLIIRWVKDCRQFAE